MKHILLTLACAVVLAAAASAQTPGYGPPGYPGYGGYASPGTPGSQFGQGGVRLEKGKTADAYTLRVYTGRRRPQDFEVNVERGHLVLRSLRSEQTDMRRQGGYSYSRSMSRFQRRLPLPQDAIAEQMSRTDGEGIIDIVIPKQR